MMVRVRRVEFKLSCATCSVLPALFLFLLGCAPAFAIPSPELIVGSFVSLSQMLALASAMLGGGAAYATMRARRGSPQRVPRAPLVITIGLFVLFAASVALNIYQYVGHKNETQARLEDTLLRPARTPGALPGDPEVKELSYAQQTRHPDAMTTAQADALLQAAARGERNDLLFLDVRERAEREIGTLKGVTFVRYPDIPKSGLDLKGKKAILFCHNGNRSHEVCEALKKQGIDCNFIVGGVEKWVVEGRAMDGLQTRTLSELRAIPEYRNRDTLLDTPEVRRLVAEEKAIFVDARYPVEFRTHGHLPNAINLTIRRIPTDELPKHIEALPKRPIILPCYDRRGCFFSEVLGLELIRAGHDVRGRYTQPWAYFVPTARPPHVQEWIAENDKSLWARAAEWLARPLSGLAQAAGVLTAILLLALLSRFLVLPFSLKAERDQIRSRALAGEFDALKEKFKADPVRKARAIRAFYARHGITPARNLLALAFLPLMAVALLAVQQMSATSKLGWLWISDLSQRDPLLILPVVFGVLIALYVDLAFARNRQHRIVIWATVFPLMVMTGTLFGAGADLYLAASAALLLLQRVWADGSIARLMQAWRRSRLPEGVIALDDPDRLASHGNKAYRLARMRAAGMPVPDGLLLTAAFTRQHAAGTPEIRRAQLDRLWRRLGRAPLAVRSSARDEDSGSHSFAGVFESVINVDRAGLDAAIAKVVASFEAGRVSAYLFVSNLGSVLLQRMVDAEYSGVLFTRDPSAGGLAMVELVQGTAENLVSGSVRARTYRLGRVTGKLFGKAQPPIDLAPLLALGREAERLFGKPQDVEWAYHGGRFYLVQSRDITRTLAGSDDAVVMQDDLARALDLAKGAGADEIVFGKNELSEMLPRPTPLSLSLMQALWASGGSVDRAARELGLSYRVAEDSTYLTTVLGRLYVDKRQEKSRALVIGPLAARRLFRQADRIEREFREDYLPELLAETRLLAVSDLDKLTPEDLVAETARLYDRFVHDTHVEADIINIAAGFYLERARKALVAAGLDPSRLLGHIPETMESRALAEIAALPEKNRRWLLLKCFGHRAVLDYELAEPRYAEDLKTLTRMVAGRAPAARPAYQDTPALRRSVARMVDVARRFQTLKEDAKHHSLRELACLRRAVVALDKRYGLDGGAFYLRFEELLSLSGQTVAKLRALAADRQQQAAHLRPTAPPPVLLTAHDIEALSAGDLSELHAAPDQIRGTRVSGDKVIEGRARVIAEGAAEEGEPLEDFRDGDIIVATMINPSWLPYFGRAGGFVSEVGGWLSHPAILAREYGVAMIVGTEGLAQITDGAFLRLHLDGRIEIVAEGTARGRVAAA